MSEINLGELSFKAEEFDKFVLDTFRPYERKDDPDKIADIANRILREKLEKAPLVDGYIHDDGYILMDRKGDQTKPSGKSGMLYTARLVLIEEIKK